MPESPVALAERWRGRG